MEKRALQLASVASMIDLFNRDNIAILQDLGFKVDVATNFKEGSITSQERVNNFREELHAQSIDTYQIPIPRSIFKIGNIVKSYFLVKTLVTENSYDIVHCHSPIGGVICRLACRKTRNNGTKVVYTAHGFHFYKGSSLLSWLLFYPLEQLCSFYTDVLITINNEDYLRAKKMHANKVIYIPGIGVHTELFENNSVDCDEKRKELGLDKDDFVFMSTGQLSVRKNHIVIIKALALIDDPKCKYLLVGFGEEENHLRQLAEKLGITNRVVFAGYREDVKDLLKISDVFIFPSLQEGLPVSLMEAMAAGLPVICSNIRGNVDLIKDEEYGYLYEPHDVNGFFEGMERIRKSSNRKSMGFNNMRIIKQYDSLVINDKMLELYSNIIV